MTAVWPGNAFPLGATWDGSGTNFSIFSEHAERVELCLFDGGDAEQRVDLTERTAHTWHCFLPGIGPGEAYADYDEHQGWLRIRRGEHLVLANFSRNAVHVPVDRAVELELATHHATVEPGHVVLPPLAGALVR